LYGQNSIKYELYKTSFGCEKLHIFFLHILLISKQTIIEHKKQCRSTRDPQGEPMYTATHTHTKVYLFLPANYWQSPGKQLAELKRDPH